MLLPSVGTLRAGFSHLLVVVESTLRFFKGGGDKDASLALAFALGFEFAFMILRSDAEEKGRIEKRSNVRYWQQSSKTF